MKKLLSLIFTLLLTLPVSLFAQDKVSIVDHKVKKNGTELTCTIDDVDDGDTVDLRCGENVIPAVRLLAINTPDIVMPDNIKHCYYDEARNVMKKIMQENRKVTAIFYGSDLCADKSKGCRNLARLIDNETRLDINERLVSQGYAFSWTDFSMVPDIIRARYKRAEKIASKNELGLWGKCNVAYISTQVNSTVPDRMTW